MSCVHSGIHAYVPSQLFQQWPREHQKSSHGLYLSSSVPLDADVTLSHRGAWQRERRWRLDAEEREQTLLHHLNRLLQGQRDAHQPEAAAAAAASQPVARPAQDRAVDVAHSDVKGTSLVGGLKGRREDAGCGGVGLAASGQTEVHAPGVSVTRHAPEDTVDSVMDKPASIDAHVGRESRWQPNLPPQALALCVCVSVCMYRWMDKYETT